MLKDTPLVNQAVKEAKNLPELVDKLNELDPSYAKQITGKALVASKSVWGVAASGVITYAVAREGLGWDQNTVDLVSGLVVIGATAFFRWLSSTPISGIFKSKKATPTP